MVTITIIVKSGRNTTLTMLNENELNGRGITVITKDVGGRVVITMQEMAMAKEPPLTKTPITTMPQQLLVIQITKAVRIIMTPAEATTAILVGEMGETTEITVAGATMVLVEAREAMVLARATKEKEKE